MCATMPNSGTVCAAANPSSTSSELAGLVWALLWAIATFPQVPVTFYTDSTSAIGLTIGHFCPAGESQLATLAAMLFRYKATRCAASCRHVKAHSGDPWNELADWMAAVPQFAPGTDLPYRIGEQAALAVALDWLWIGSG